MIGTWINEHSTSGPSNSISITLTRVSDTELNGVVSYLPNNIWPITWDGVKTLTFGTHKGVYDGDRTILWLNGKWVKQGTHKLIIIILV